MMDPLAVVPDYIRGVPMTRRQHNGYQSCIDAVQAGKENAVEDLKELLIEEGAYFYSIDEVLSDDHLDKYDLETITKRKDGSARIDFAEAFCRVNQVPNYNSQGHVNGVQEFQVTRRGAQEALPAAPSDCSSHGTKTKRTIWNVDIFGRPFAEVKSSEIAHLLPDAATHALEWYDVACWALGYDPRIVRWEDIFRLLHGTKPGKKRTFGSGIRHFVANKARINQQEKLIDKDDPQLLLLPILSRKQCLEWNGGDYDAIVLVGTDEEKGSYSWAVKEVGMNDVRTSSGMGDATEDDFKESMRLLRHCTFAMVQALVNFEPPPVDQNANEEQKRKMQDAVKARQDRLAAFRTLVGKGQISVPNVKKKLFSVDKSQFRGICKVSFSNKVDKILHPAPDPLLLVTRASVVWSVRNKFRLRASAIAADDSYYEWEQDLRQLEHIQQLHRHQRFQDMFSETGLAVKRYDMADDEDASDSMSDLSTEMFIPDTMTAS